MVHVVLVCTKGALSASLLSQWLLKHLLQVVVLLLEFCSHIQLQYILYLLAQLLSSDLIDIF